MKPHFRDTKWQKTQEYKSLKSAYAKRALVLMKRLSSSVLACGLCLMANAFYQWKPYNMCDTQIFMNYKMQKLQDK